MKDPYQSDDPEERATRLADAMLDGLRASPEYDEDVRALAFVYPNTGRGGIGATGYDDGEPELQDTERILADALQSLDAMAELHGLKLMIVKRGEG